MYFEEHLFGFFFTEYSLETKLSNGDQVNIYKANKPLKKIMMLKDRKLLYGFPKCGLKENSLNQG